MTGKAKELTITEQIDIDEGLKTKRKLLTVTSLILLALSFSGANVEEANTFILKLKFDNQNGIAILLVLAIIFLIIRYLNYAKPYHEMLFNEWTGRMLRNNYFSCADYHDNELYGLAIDMIPEGIDLNSVQHGGDRFDFHYKCSWFKRSLVYSWTDQYDYHRQEVNVGWRNYFKVISLETKYQFGSFINHRENLDIMGPYFLGVLAISSYFFHEELQLVLNALAVK
jgi:hypothetical protein